MKDSGSEKDSRAFDLVVVFSIYQRRTKNNVHRQSTTLPISTQAIPSAGREHAAETLEEIQLLKRNNS